MGSSILRQKLHSYIRFAEDKKIKAIYTMVEDDIATNYQWWEDKNLMAAISKDASEIKKGTQKTFSLMEMKKTIETARKKSK
ncbi:MAG: hypothetical protein H7X88_12840 [Gloeobacteraceae cyanobacterium ES-bin-316]|nr:hypothetical protein [Ferruginibacter sp.]